MIYMWFDLHKQIYRPRYKHHVIQLNGCLSGEGLEIIMLSVAGSSSGYGFNPHTEI